MPVDLSVDMIKATVQLEQSLGDGTRTVGTGFLLSSPGPDGKPHTILVTAAHVLQKMPQGEARIGYRFQTEGGGWRYDPQPLTIRTRSATWRRWRSRPRPSSPRPPSRWPGWRRTRPSTSTAFHRATR